MTAIFRTLEPREWAVGPEQTIRYLGAFTLYQGAIVLDDSLLWQAVEPGDYIYGGRVVVESPAGVGVEGEVEFIGQVFDKGIGSSPELGGDFAWLQLRREDNQRLGRSGLRLWCVKRSRDQVRTAELAHRAYNAARAEEPGYDGSPIPAFHELGEDRQRRWQAVADALLLEFRRSR